MSAGGAEVRVNRGTISEMAFGLRHGRVVIVTADAPNLSGAFRHRTAEDVTADHRPRPLA